MSGCSAWAGRWWCSGLLATLLLWSAGLAGSVVQALDPRDAPPRVTASVLSPPPPELRRVALLPFADAPRSPQTGAFVTAIFHRALDARGLTVVVASAPLDSLGRTVPSNLVPNNQLLQIGREAGADALVVGRALNLAVEERERPYLTLRTPSAWIDLPDEVRVRTTAAIQLRVLDVRRGRSAYEGSGQYGPVDHLDPEEAVTTLVEAALAPWFPPAAPADGSED